MKKLSYNRELKEVPFTIKNLDESFLAFVEDSIDIPDFNDDETLEDYIYDSDIKFSDKETKQLPILFNDWLKENPDIVESIQIRHKIYDVIKPLIDRYGDTTWDEMDNLREGYFYNLEN